MSNTDFISFAHPYMGDEEIQEVTQVLKSGWLVSGPRVKQFEADLRAYLQAPYVASLTSATAGLHLALLALEFEPGFEVITTPMTFIASLNSICLSGGKPVLVDIDFHTRNINVDAIEAKITERTKAIMPVHFAGLPVDLDPLYALAKKYHLRVIEDAAHAIGTEYKGKRIGSFGDIQVFSFYANKNITTGEGGAVSTRDEALYKKICSLRFHGIDRDAFNRYSKEGSQAYDVIFPGYKYNMMDLQAALGIHQLPRLNHFTDVRQKLAARYQEVLRDWDMFDLPQAPAYDHRHAWHLYQPLLKTEKAGMTRDAFMNAMKQENIGLGLHYEPCHLFSYYQKQFGYRAGDFPIAEDVGKRTVSLPLFPSMTENDFQRVIDTMQRILIKK